MNFLERLAEKRLADEFENARIMQTTRQLAPYRAAQSPGAPQAVLPKPMEPQGRETAASRSVDLAEEKALRDRQEEYRWRQFQQEGLQRRQQLGRPLKLNEWQEIGARHRIDPNGVADFYAKLEQANPLKDVEGYDPEKKLEYKEFVRREDIKPGKKYYKTPPAEKSERFDYWDKGGKKHSLWILKGPGFNERWQTQEKKVYASGGSMAKPVKEGEPTDLDRLKEIQKNAGDDQERLQKAYEAERLLSTALDLFNRGITNTSQLSPEEQEDIFVPHGALNRWFELEMLKRKAGSDIDAAYRGTRTSDKQQQSTQEKPIEPPSQESPYHVFDENQVGTIRSEVARLKAEGKTRNEIMGIMSDRLGVGRGGKQEQEFELIPKAEVPAQEQLEPQEQWSGKIETLKDLDLSPGGQVSQPRGKTAATFLQEFMSQTQPEQYEKFGEGPIEYALRRMNIRPESLQERKTIALKLKAVYPQANDEAIAKMIEAGEVLGKEFVTIP